MARDDGRTHWGEGGVSYTMSDHVLPGALVAAPEELSLKDLATLVKIAHEGNMFLRPLALRVLERALTTPMSLVADEEAN